MNGNLRRLTLRLLSFIINISNIKQSPEIDQHIYGHLKSDKCAKQFNEKRIVVLTNDAGRVVYPFAKK